MAILASLLNPKYLEAVVPYAATLVLVLVASFILREKPYPGIKLIGMDKGRFGMQDFKGARLKYLTGISKLFKKGLSEV